MRLRCFIAAVSVGVVLCVTISASAAPASNPAADYMEVYPVNKQVRDFPAEEDLSKPETAYVAINRLMASGQQGQWQHLSIKEIAARLPAGNTPPKKVSPEDAATWLNATTLEVRIFKGLRAVVIARLTYPDGRVRFDLRSLRFDHQQGHWLNAGEGITDSLEEARAIFARECARNIGQPARPKIDNPDAYLSQCVEFLKSQGREPRSAIMDLLARYRVVLMGEIHHRPRYWAFNASLVSDPAFADHVGVIFLELSANDQPHIDRFLAAPELDTQPAIEALRGMMVMGWPDQAMLDFLVTVWKTNKALPANRKIRIVLADMARPWSQIHQPKDMRLFNVDRNRFMADTVLGDLRAHQTDERAALFIVGLGHAMLDLQYFDGTPIASAGYYLQKELGRAKVTAIFPHTCVMTNVGQVSGRLGRGLFESAFKALDNKPIAFPLSTGPFSELPFDGFPDEPVANCYKDGYDTYLYLGPLENEVFSPLTEGFYTDEFVKEVDRRYRLSNGKGWAESTGRKLDAQSFIRWMKRDWGRPRREWSAAKLGPLDAWRGKGQ